MTHYKVEDESFRTQDEAYRYAVLASLSTWEPVVVKTVVQSQDDVDELTGQRGLMSFQADTNDGVIAAISIGAKALNIFPPDQPA